MVKLSQSSSQPPQTICLLRSSLSGALSILLFDDFTIVLLSRKDGIEEEFRGPDEQNHQTSISQDFTTKENAVVKIYN